MVSCPILPTTRNTSTQSRKPRHCSSGSSTLRRVILKPFRPDKPGASLHRPASQPQERPKNKTRSENTTHTPHLSRNRRSANSRPAGHRCPSPRHRGRHGWRRRSAPCSSNGSRRRVRHGRRSPPARSARARRLPPRHRVRELALKAGRGRRRKQREQQSQQAKRKDVIGGWLRGRRST